MPEFIDSSKLHISIEHLVIVPEAIPINTILILNHVKFGPGKTTFSSVNTNVDLINLVAAMQKSPDLKIQISGHTDRSGNEQTNKKLSKSRAKFVYDHLITKGVSEQRISYNGYGSAKPAYSNKSKDGRAANRRIEVKVISKKAESMTNLVDETPVATEDSFELHANSSLLNFEKKEIGEALILKHILFEPNMTYLTQNSKLQADTLVEILKANTAIVIEVFGYTDRSGIEDKNIILSKNRAKALHDYLIESGIDRERLFYSGCGSGNPIASNKYRWGRDINRRIEVVIIKK
jgi:outer membrane protein OmpA-like peptidoglycan-associated protein